MPEYIEREAAIQAVEKTLWQYQQSVIEIRKVPASDVAPVRHGRIIQTIEDGHMKRVFSCCGNDFTKMTCWMMPKYCPECGALMDGGEQDA